MSQSKNVASMPNSAQPPVESADFNAIRCSYEAWAISIVWCAREEHILGTTCNSTSFHILLFTLLIFALTTLIIRALSEFDSNALIIICSVLRTVKFNFPHKLSLITDCWEQLSKRIQTFSPPSSAHNILRAVWRRVLVRTLVVNPVKFVFTVWYSGARSL